MKTKIFLFLAFVFLQGIFFSFFDGLFTVLTNRFDVAQLFSILYIDAIAWLFSSSFALILSLYVLEKRYREIIQDTYKIFFLILFLFNFFIGVGFLYYSFSIKSFLSNSLFLSSVIILFVSLVIYYYWFRLLYAVFFLKKYKKAFTALIALGFITYSFLLLFPIYEFHREYSQAILPEGFSGKYATQITALTGINQNTERNAAEDLTRLIIKTSQKEEKKDGAGSTYVTPDAEDLTILENIARAGYIDFQEKYLPKEFLRIGGAYFNIPTGHIRKIDRGFLELAKEKKEQGNTEEAIRILQNSLELGFHLSMDKNDTFIIPMIGQRIGLDSAKQLIEIYQSNLEQQRKIQLLEQYISENEAIKKNISFVLSLFEFPEIEESSFYDMRKTALLFKTLDKLSADDPLHMTITNALTDHLYSENYYSIFFQTAISTIENEQKISDIFTGILTQHIIAATNIGKNYLYYKKLKEISHLPERKYLASYLQDNLLHITKKYYLEIPKIYELSKTTFAE